MEFKYFCRACKGEHNKHKAQTRCRQWISHIFNKYLSDHDILGKYRERLSDISIVAKMTILWCLCWRHKSDVNCAEECHFQVPSVLTRQITDIEIGMILHVDVLNGEICANHWSVLGHGWKIFISSCCDMENFAVASLTALKFGWVHTRNLVSSTFLILLAQWVQKSGYKSFHFFIDYS